MSAFHLRGIPEEVMSLIKQEAKRLQISVNKLILQLVARGLGRAEGGAKIVYHDLDHLAGTWSREEAKTFEENTKPFGKVDKELWP